MALTWSILVLCAIGMVGAQSGYPRDAPSNQLQYDSSRQDYSNDEDNEVHGDEIPGEAGTDYPIYAEVPDTGFSCDNQQYPGYYADPQSQCQAFYICQKGGHKDALLCPNGTIFNQEVLVCDWWYNVDCSKAEELYSKNELIVKAMEEADARLEQQRSQFNGYPSQNGNGNGNHAAIQSSNGYNKPSNGNGIKPVYGAPASDLTDAQYVNGNGIKPVYGAPSNGAGASEKLNNGNGNNGFGHNGNGNGNGIKPVYGVPSTGARLESLGNGNGNGHNTNGNGHNANGNGHNANGNGHNANGNGHNANGNGHNVNGNGHNGNRNGNNGNGIKPVYGVPSTGARLESLGNANGNGHNGNGQNGNGNGHKVNGNGNGHNVNGNGNGHNVNGNGNGHNVNGNGHNGNGRNGNGNGAPANGGSRTYLPPNGNGLNGNGHRNGNGNGHRNGNGNGNGNGHKTANGNGHRNGNGNGSALDNTVDNLSAPIDESVDVFQSFNTANDDAPSRTYLPPV